MSSDGLDISSEGLEEDAESEAESPPSSSLQAAKPRAS